MPVRRVREGPAGRGSLPVRLSAEDQLLLVSVGCRAGTAQVMGWIPAKNPPALRFHEKVPPASLTLLSAVAIFSRPLRFRRMTVGNERIAFSDKQRHAWSLGGFFQGRSMLTNHVKFMDVKGTVALNLIDQKVIWLPVG